MATIAAIRNAEAVEMRVAAETAARIEASVKRGLFDMIAAAVRDALADQGLLIEQMTSRIAELEAAEAARAQASRTNRK